MASVFSLELLIFFFLSCKYKLLTVAYRSTEFFSIASKNYEKDVNEVLKSFPHLKAYCSKILSNYASVNFEYLQDLSSNEIAKAKKYKET